ncbi:MAG: BREX system P-loop protein BrxC, partial [Planctomycetales bacterium]|nr:BREX system P-loop protein BrxC [Planctomycetales bacterium]
LNFFVDEVGQYIADNPRLMTNLQTIAESLATKCQGRAWIVVTAQGDMDTVIGEMTKEQGNDFSRIQARFKHRLKLTSQNVAEVIQLRLLTKTKEAKDDLIPLYEREQNNFKTLFDFADGSQNYRNFRNQDHFVDCYPFVPYQFDLFQLAIRHLSDQNAFEGRHSSVGERSMLGVFQEVAKQIADCEVGELATFDRMYEGIRTSLKTGMQHAIGAAERNLDSDLAVRLLKALFLVKYVREFKPTLRNLCVLMFDHFDRKPNELAKEVSDALQVLESQVYIQRNGEMYEFLTDEEKDVEQEIKNTDVDSTDVAKELSDIIFDQVIRSRKLRYEATKQDFSYTRKLDDRSYGREYELSVHVISPFHDEYDRLESIKMRSMGSPELLVVLPPDDRLLRDVTLYKQTAKYVSQNLSLTQHESVKRILAEKQVSNAKRKAAIADAVSEAFAEAKLFVGNSEVESNSRDPNARLHDGFEQLVIQNYTNLKLLRGVQYSEHNIHDCLTGEGNDLFGADATSLSEAETEMLSRIQLNGGKGLRTTVKTLIEDFERRPFGWPLAAILCILAKLCGRGKIEARSGSQVLDDDDLVAALKNTRQHANIILDPQIDFTGSQVRRLKDFYEQFFDEVAGATEAKALGEQTAKTFGKLHHELLELRNKRAEFPFLSLLDEPAARIAPLGERPFKYFFTEFEALSEELLDIKENLLDPIRVFMSGSQAEIYARAAAFHRQHEANLSYLVHDGIGSLASTLKDPNCFRGAAVQSLATLTRQLEISIEELLSAERANAAVELDRLRERIESHPGYMEVDDNKKRTIHTTFEKVASTVSEQPLVPLLRETVRRF